MIWWRPIYFKLVCTILISEVPLVYSAFRMSGYMPSQVSYYIASALLATAMCISTKYTHCIIIFQICQHWVRQCFWNFLDWPEVCLYLTTCTLLGADYQVCGWEALWWGIAWISEPGEYHIVLQCDTLPYCPLAYIHSMYDAKGNSFKTSPSSNLQRELTCIIFPLLLMELYQWEHFYAKPGYSHPLSGVADPTGNGL